MLRAIPVLDLDPGPRTLYVATSSQEGILYDMDDRPGRLLYLDSMSDPAVIPLCRGLASLIDCYIALAEAGFITLQTYCPSVAGPFDEVRDIFVTHGVTHTLITGTDTWLGWPG